MSSIVLVILQVVALGIVIWPWHAPQWNAWAWLPLGVAFALKAWMIAHNPPTNFSVLPEVRNGARLVVTGPYRFVRHPLYLALIVFAAGCAIGWNTAVHWIAAAALIIVLNVKARREERFLEERFADYRDYAGRVPRLVPMRWPQRSSPSST
ncbi:MAG TPA: isoprenylcysteine carboxylmethyltransferase family protein [Casimicrobiaceae bacterium]|nr:isoprenylcysteine carboxylmethyltransferase family protein [Casimicrobiaceae bacterium]